MNALRKLAVVFVLLSPMAANADLIITDVGITVGNVEQSGAADSAGGTVILDATSGNLVVGDIRTNGGDDVDDSGGNAAGDVTLGGQDINLGAITALGSAAQSVPYPDGADGDVLITASGSVVVGGNINVNEGQIDIFVDADELISDGVESLTIQGTMTATTINLDGRADVQNDSLIVSLTGGDTVTWTVNGPNSGTLDAGASSTATFTNFSDLIGGDQTDIFNIDSVVAGALDGGEGADTFDFGFGSTAYILGFDFLDSLLVNEIFGTTPSASAGDDLFLLGYLSFEMETLSYRDFLSDDFSIFASLDGFDGFLISDPLDPFRIIASVPEPGTLALLGIGLLGMGAARRRKKA